MSFCHWRYSVVAVIVFGVLFGFCSSERAPFYSFVKYALHAPSISFYDYIIIGGGTAGCPLAATLSERYKVLLLERGGSPYTNSNISSLSTFSRTLSDNSPTSASQRFVSTDGVLNTRARILGGGTCLNAGFYTRASPWYVGQAHWDGRLVNQSYEWVEKMIVFEPPMRQWQSAMRDALLEVGVTPDNGFTYDHMYGTKIGGSIFDRDGRRHTAADLLQYANPYGLTVYLHARVDKIVFDGSSKPTARAVLFTDEMGVTHEAMLNGEPNSEIILSSGALGSPQLLMLSGIGPRDQLEALGIEVVRDTPMVGQRMADNPMNAIFLPSPAPVEVSLIQVVGITNFGSFIEGASGSNFAAHYMASNSKFGMFSPETGELFTVHHQSNISQSMDSMSKFEDNFFRGGFLLEKTMGPLSTGHLTLMSKNPDENPSVTFNYFDHPEDLRRCVEGIRTIERMIQTRAFSSFRYSYISVETLLNLTLAFPVNNIPKHSNDSKNLEQFCKDTVMTIWHYHGGCRVGQVVDNDYKVIGVNSLRVVDGSTFNYSPGTNPQATVMMLGRYMGVKILSNRMNEQKTSGKP